MGLKRYRVRSAGLRGASSSFTISSAQIRAAELPAQSAQTLVTPVAQSRRSLGRPWFIWKDDQELARVLNDRLATGAN